MYIIAPVLRGVRTVTLTHCETCKMLSQYVVGKWAGSAGSDNRVTVLAGSANVCCRAVRHRVEEKINTLITSMHVQSAMLCGEIRKGRTFVHMQTYRKGEFMF